MYNHDINNDYTFGWVSKCLEASIIQNPGMHHIINHVQTLNQHYSPNSCCNSELETSSDQTVQHHDKVNVNCNAASLRTAYNRSISTLGNRIKVHYGTTSVTEPCHKHSAHIKQHRL